MHDHISIHNMMKLLAKRNCKPNTIVLSWWVLYKPRHHLKALKRFGVEPTHIHCMIIMKFATPCRHTFEPLIVITILHKNPNKTELLNI